MANNIGIDLGTANVLIYVQGEGIVLDEPSVVAIDVKSNEILAVGQEAYMMVGRTPNSIQAVRPLAGGVISNFDLTLGMLEALIKKVNVKSFFTKPDILICCPTNITTIEQRAITEAAEKLGARNVYLEEEPKVAAVGAGIDIFQPSGNMVIDIGGGTADAAVLSMGGIVTSRSIKIAGNTLDVDITQAIKANHNLLIGQRTAEDIKVEIGSVTEDIDKSMEVRGRELVSGLPKTIEVDSNEVRTAILDSVMSIITMAKEVLEKTAPELSADIIDHGVVLTGGGAQLDGLDALIAEELKVPVLVAEDPLNSVVLGTGILLDNLSKTSHSFFKSKK